MSSASRRTFLKAMAGAAAFPASDAAAASSGDARGKAAPAWPLGLTTYMFKAYDLAETLAMARRVDVRRICLRSNLLPLSASAEQIAAAMQQVKAAGCTVYGGGVLYMRQPDDVGRAFDHCRAAGYTLISASIRPDLLPLVEKQVRAHDVRVAIHNHGPEDQHYPTPQAVMEKVRRFDPRIGVCHDTGHTLRAGVDPAEATRACGERLHDVHLKDVDARTAAGHSVELGRGVMDIPEFLDALRAVEYHGVLGVEYEKHMDDLLPGLAECVGYARGVLDAAAGGA
jgi:sugar phosphate isomerase/epimerase